ncbi:hypothetical protein [Brevibacillus borstelensis]|uniref:TlpA family protein disulfide reductase n=1 Tax=Brevibacillus borstelensis TaxID=45462 RepID=UPI0030BD0374
MNNGLVISNLLLWVVVFVQTIILFFFIRLVVQFLNRFRVNDKQVTAATLTIGEKAPVFREKDQHGEVVQATEDVEKQTFMLFTNDTCGTCKAIIPELPHILQDYPDVRVIVVSNPIYYEKGLEVPSAIHLVRSNDLINKFLIQIVPTAVLIDHDGIIRAIRQVTSIQDIMAMFDIPVEKVG